MSVQQASSSTRRSSSNDTAPNRPLYLPPESLRPSLAWFLFAVFLQVASSMVLIVVVFVDLILLPYNNTLTSTGQLIYIIPVTIAATGVAIITETEIRKLWAYLIVRSSLPSSSSSLSASDSDGCNGGKTARRTAVVLGLSSVKDMLRTIYIPMAFGISGLITTAIVTGLQATSMVVVNDMPLVLKPGRNVSWNPDSSSVSMHDSACFHSSGSDIPARWFTWNLTDGESLSVGYTPDDDDDALEDPDCAAYKVLDMFKTLDDSLGFDYHGIHISREAATVPLGDERLPRVIFSQRAQGWWWDAKKTALGVPSVSSFRWASTCLPAMTQSVASCRRAGSLERKTNRMGVTYGNCTVERSRAGGDGGDSQSFARGEMVAGACTGDRPIGTATILMGATGEYGRRLQAALQGSPGFDDEGDEVDEEDCAVVCEIDVRSSLTFRGRLVRPADSWEEVSSVLEVVAADLEPGSSTRKPEEQSSGWGDTCDAYDAQRSPLDISQFLTDPALAVAAAGSWQLLAESYNRDDGLLSTLMHIADTALFCPGGNIGNDAQSCMEELLTMASRIALGFYFGENTINVDLEDMEYDSFYKSRWVVIGGGRRASTSVRVGINEPWAIVLIMPMLLATVILLVLWRRVMVVRDDVAHRHR